MYKYSEFYSHDEKKEAMQVVTDAGFPELGVFTQMAEMNPELIKLFVEKEVLVNNYPMKFITNEEKQVIYVVVSAANNCEMCLSFHAAALLQEGNIEEYDLDRLLSGGNSNHPKFNKITIATKYAMAHKGILLPREKKHLHDLGISKEMYGEILFLTGQIHANNMLFAYLISENCPVENTLQSVGPFKDTVYKNKEKELSVVVKHGVACFQDWLTKYKDADSHGFHNDLGVTSSMVHQGETTPDGTETCIVTHYYPESAHSAINSALKFDKPPFVGGDDLIAKGIVKRPIEVIWGKVVEKTVHAPKSKPNISLSTQQQVTGTIEQMIEEDIGSDFKIDNYRKWRDRYHTDKCIMIRPSGNPLDKDSFEKMLFGGDITNHTRKLIGIDNVTVLNENSAAVVTYRDHSEFTYKGVTNNDISTWTSVLKRFGNQWKVVQAQRSTGSEP